jgi:3-oxoacyl-[acyl-carrier-protein] synthase-3
MIGILSTGTYFPATLQTAADLAPLTQIPEGVLREKMGIRQRHIAQDHETVSLMASQAAQVAIERSGIRPDQINMVISHGSEHKDHVVWNAAAKIQHNVGAVNAFGFEVYALCAGAPIALNVARGMMSADPALNYVLLAAASRENDLVNLRNERVRFMYNFGAGGGAMILVRNATHNVILGASAITDGSLSETVVMSRTMDAVGEGSEAVGDVRGRLEVTDPAYMAERLGENSLANFVKVIRGAVESGRASMANLKFLGLTHMKRSFYLEILSAVGLTADQSVYLEDYGHIQSVDQVLALELGLAAGKIKDGDLIVLAGAGVGYTWSAVAIQWGKS